MKRILMIEKMWKWNNFCLKFQIFNEKTWKAIQLKESVWEGKLF